MRLYIDDDKKNEKEKKRKRQLLSIRKWEWILMLITKLGGRR